MNIAVKSDINVIVTKNFTEGFHVHTSFNTSCSECVPKSMKADILQITGFCTFLKVITQQPRLYVCFIARQEKTVVRYIRQTLRIAFGIGISLMEHLLLGSVIMTCVREAVVLILSLCIVPDMWIMP